MVLPLLEYKTHHILSIITLNIKYSLKGFEQFANKGKFIKSIQFLLCKIKQNFFDQKQPNFLNISLHYKVKRISVPKVSLIRACDTFPIDLKHLIKN